MQAGQSCELTRFVTGDAGCSLAPCAGRRFRAPPSPTSRLTMSGMNHDAGLRFGLQGFTNRTRMLVGEPKGLQAIQSSGRRSSSVIPSATARPGAWIFLVQVRPTVLRGSRARLERPELYAMRALFRRGFHGLWALPRSSPARMAVRPAALWRPPQRLRSRRLRCPRRQHCRRHWGEHWPCLLRRARHSAVPGPA